MDFLSYIINNCLIVVPALNIIGVFLKGAKKIPDWIIPFVLLVLGIAACIVLSMRPESGMTWIDGAIQGVLVTGAAVLVNQGIKQIARQD